MTQLGLEDLKEGIIASAKEASIDGLSPKLEERILILAEAIYQLGVDAGIDTVSNMPLAYDLIPIDEADEYAQENAINRLRMMDDG